MDLYSADGIAESVGRPHHQRLWQRCIHRGRLSVTRHHAESIGGGRKRGNAERGLHRGLIIRDDDPGSAAGWTYGGAQYQLAGGLSFPVRCRGIRLGAGQLEDHSGVNHWPAGYVGNLGDQGLGQHLAHTPALTVTSDDADGRRLALAGEYEIVAATRGNAQTRDAKEDDQSVVG